MVNFGLKIEQRSGKIWAKFRPAFGPKFGRILEAKFWRLFSVGFFLLAG